MQFKHSQIIDAPVDYVFARATDFKRFEAQSGTKGFKFARHEKSPIRIGTRWHITVPFRGRGRKFSAELSEMIPPRTISYKSTSNKYSAALSLKFTPVGAGKCQLNMLVVAQSRSFTTSLVFNSIRLARRRINKRVTTTMEEFAVRISEDYHQSSDPKA